MKKPSIILLEDRDYYSDIPGDDIGDALSASKYVWMCEDAARKYVKENGYVQYIPTLGYNPYDRLSKLINIDRDAMVKKLRYCCELTKNKYELMIPLGILTKDASQYSFAENDISEGARFDYMWNMMMDGDWNKMSSSPLFADYTHIDRISSIERAYMGHGVLFFGDGSASDKFGIVKLDNDDLLVVHFWIWYNK